MKEIKQELINDIITLISKAKHSDFSNEVVNKYLQTLHELKEVETPKPKSK